MILGNGAPPVEAARSHTMKTQEPPRLLNLAQPSCRKHGMGVTRAKSFKDFDFRQFFHNITFLKNERF
ncbi:MAG: hypothetical protein CR217_10540 [Beijerinckiaceae bacterium]|nr:MAG: hypothetical protein CR217_10540 [Beijerinckiaceae bacterium]